MRHIIIICFTLFSLSNIQSQQVQLIQFSGMILDADSLDPIPFSQVIVKNTSRGTSADYFGFFSFVAQKGDTILFSSLGYKPQHYIIPDSLEKNLYSIIQVLQKDTIELDPITVYPWPSKEEFKQAFLNLRLPSTDYQRAMQNLEQARIKAKFQGIQMDAVANYKYTMNQYQTRLYNSGMYPINNLLNPFAWAKFIDEWKKGTYKKKKGP